MIKIEECKELMLKAKKILKNNWVGNSTKPAPHLYPHKWNWDSGFISIGYSHYDQEKAQKELLSLFKGQWKNGMLPHIIYNPNIKEDYFPNPDFWEIDKSSNAPSNLKTSGITQPPIHATAALKIYENSMDKLEAKNFLKEIFPKIKKLHSYLYKYRDPKEANHSGVLK
ncbi:MAG: hypothetical protein ACE5KE_08225 [Methanosarcinales archaeon]